MKSIQELELANRRVLVRADLNVPLKEDLTIADDFRIKQFLPTLKYLIEKNAKIIVMSHLEGSGGKMDPRRSLKPIAQKIAEALKVSVRLAPDCVGPEVEKLVRALKPGEILMLENIRFNPGEKTNDHAFATQLAKLGEIFINDAFAASHRLHASIVSVPKFFKERAPGLLMQKEIEYYERALVKPRKPLCVVLGGSKVSNKFNALLNIASKADKIIIGGAMANTFLAAQGLQMGRSLYEPELFPKVLELLVTLARRDCKLYLPVDFMVGPSAGSKGLARAFPAQEIPADMMALDIGPATSLLYKEALYSPETIIWSGPMGAFENDDYGKGTTDMIEHLASAHGLTVAGGGDTAHAISQMELAHKFDFISTGGGAFLTLLEGNSLPGLLALR